MYEDAKFYLVQFEYKCIFAGKSSGPSPTSKSRRKDGLPHHGATTSGLSPGSEKFSIPTMSPNTNGIDCRTFVPSSEQPGLSDPVRAKFWTAYSAVAFPRLLATEYSAENAPRVHCFAWNMGIRQEEPEADADVASLLTLDEARRLSDIYFTIVHPEIGFLDRAVYEKNMMDRWNGALEDRGYDCVICGVTALGSFFAGSLAHANERRLVKTVKEVLQSSSVIYYPTINHIAAWILRTIYLRLTTRPNGAWLSSCALAHILESTGIYKDQGSAPFLSTKESSMSDAEIEYRRRLFWIGWSLNGMISCEYGRTKVELDVTCRKPRDDSNVSMPLIAIADCIGPRSVPEKREDKSTMLLSTMDDLCSLNVDTDFHEILRSDMIFSIYRRLRLLQYRLSKDSSNRILAAGSSALEAVSRLASKQRAWWNLLSCPFQFTCVCLAMDSPESFAFMNRAMTTLKSLSQRFDTHMVREALQVANTLVRLARDRKANDLRSLEACMPQATSPVPQTEFEVPGLDDPMIWSWGDDTFAWDLLLPSEQATN